MISDLDTGRKDRPSQGLTFPNALNLSRQIRMKWNLTELTIPALLPKMGNLYFL